MASLFETHLALVDAQFKTIATTVDMPENDCTAYKHMHDKNLL